MIKLDIIGHEEVEVEEGITLEKLAKRFQTPEKPKIVAAIVNNKLRELTNTLAEDSTIEFVDLSSLDGVRIYQRGLTYLLIRSAKELFENIEINLLHSLSKGLFFEVDYKRSLNKRDIIKIKEEMQRIIEKGEVFEKIKVSKEEARKHFIKFKMPSKTQILDYREYDYINLYKSGWMKNYFYGYMVPSTDYLEVFDLMLYDQGIILRHPTPFSPKEVPAFVESPNLAKIFREYEDWASIMNCSYVANLNNKIENNEYQELINISESLQEKKISEIADMITKEKKRIILIAGPSSSGKTTFSKRLQIHLKVNGIHPITLSTDNYFVSREETPRDENGDYNFETIDAIDLELFNRNLNDLLEGVEVELPRFNFKKGCKEYKGDYLKITEDQPIIIEGIHGLNPRLTYDIFEKDKFKIYISALTQLNIDRHNRIPTTDARLIRRMVRDNNFRGYDAKTTIELWNSVRKGEEEYIFPFQEDADIMFNSALIYELSILKKHVQPLLQTIEKDHPAYLEAVRLLKVLQYFKSIDDDSSIPNTSILKEFIGGSIFKD